MLLAEPLIERRAAERRIVPRGGRRVGEKPGPKPIDGEPAIQAIHIRVTARQRAELEQVAAELGLDISAIIRDAVNEFVGDYSERHVFLSRDTK